MEKVVYEGKIAKVTEEVIAGTNWERVYFPDGVIIFPMNEKGQILLVEERRPHENPPIRIKAVSGILETERGSPEENAQWELQEEIGFKAQHLEKLMVMKGSGTTSNTQHFFIARGLIASKLPNPDGEDSILGLKAYDPDELLKAFMNDELKWSISTLGFFRLYHHLKSSSSND